MIGNIKAAFEVASHEETKRIQDALHTLYQAGVFNLHSGQVTLYFHQGTLMRIDGPLYVRQKVVSMQENKP